MKQFTYVVAILMFVFQAYAAESAPACDIVKKDLDQLRNAQSSIFKTMIEDQKLAAQALANFGTMVQMAPSKDLVAQMDATSMGFQKRAETSQKTLERLEKLTLATLEQAKDCIK